MPLRIRTIPILPLLILTIVLGGQNPLWAADKLVSSVAREYANGLNAKIVAAVAKRLGLKLEMKYVSFARRLALLEQGRIDFSSGLYRSAEREKYIYFIEPPYARKSSKYFFVRKGNGPKIKTYEDLYGLDIGTSIDVHYFERFDKDKKIRKTRVSKVEQKFKMLSLGRVDAVIHSFSGAYDILNRMDLADKIEIAEYSFLAENPSYFGISRRSKLMDNIAEIEPVIREMILSGEIYRIRREHYSQIKYR